MHEDTFLIILYWILNVVVNLMWKIKGILLSKFACHCLLMKLNSFKYIHWPFALPLLWLFISFAHLSTKILMCHSWIWMDYIKNINITFVTQHSLPLLFSLHYLILQLLSPFTSTTTSFPSFKAQSLATSHLLVNSDLTFLCTLKQSLSSLPPVLIIFQYV